MYDSIDIDGLAANPYRYITQPVFDIHRVTTNHKLVLVAVGTFDEKETYKSETLIDNNFLQECIEGVEDSTKYIIDQKITEFKQYLAKHGEQDEFEVTVYLNDEAINKITVDSCYIKEKHYDS